MIHSLVLFYFSVRRNITVIYSSVPELRNIAATDNHSPVHSSVNQWIYVAVYPSVNRQMYLGIQCLCRFRTITLGLPVSHTVPHKFKLIFLAPVVAQVHSSSVSSVQMPTAIHAAHTPVCRCHRHCPHRWPRPAPPARPRCRLGLLPGRPGPLRPARRPSPDRRRPTPSCCRTSPGRPCPTDPQRLQPNLHPRSHHQRLQF
jgi:hypothetical protein